MKKVWVVMGLLCVCRLSAMDLINKVCDWHNERRAERFMQRFSSKTFADIRIGMRKMPSGAYRKIFEKNAAKESELRTGVFIVAALPYELQKKILEQIDPMFVDTETAKYFLDKVPLKDALRWYAVVNKKMGKAPSYLFKKRTLFKQKFSYELTKSQMFGLSIDEICMLEGLEDGRDAKLLMQDYKSVFNKKQLITLQQLLHKGYIPSSTEMSTVDICVDYTRQKLLKVVLLDIVLPVVTSSCAQGLLLPTDPAINSKMREANKALEELEALGQGPFLKHRLEEYVCSTSSIFKYFLIKILGLFPIPIIGLTLVTLLRGKGPNLIDTFGILYSLAAPLIMSFLAFGQVFASLIREVKISEFKYMMPLEVGLCLLGEVLTFLLDEVLKDNKASLASNKTIHIAEIPAYLESKWSIVL